MNQRGQESLFVDSCAVDDQGGGGLPPEFARPVSQVTHWPEVERRKYSLARYLWPHRTEHMPLMDPKLKRKITCAEHFAFTHGESLDDYRLRLKQRQSKAAANQTERGEAK